MTFRSLILSTLLGLSVLSVEALAQNAGRGCGHGPQNNCNPKLYPREQLSAPGWCESHFIINSKGEKQHQCPKPWPKKGEKQSAKQS